MELFTFEYHLIKFTKGFVHRNSNIIINITKFYVMNKIDVLNWYTYYIIYDKFHILSSINRLKLNDCSCNLYSNFVYMYFNV